MTLADMLGVFNMETPPMMGQGALAPAPAMGQQGWGYDVPKWTIGLHGIGDIMKGGSGSQAVGKLAGKRREQENGGGTQRPRKSRIALRRIMSILQNPNVPEAARTRAMEELRQAGIPGYRRGTRSARGGLALVGEAGPELVEMPKGAKVYPNPFEEQSRQQEFDQLLPEEKKRVLELLREGMTPDESLAPPGFNPRETRFDDANAYRTADMSQLQPSGVGETNELHSAARSFQGFMRSLEDYEKLFKDGGSTMWPGARRDELSTAHRDLQMQMKELYNLGVLNGPDLELMNQILLNPTSVGGNVMDALGVADMEDRIPSNIENVRRMMINRTVPALQQLGVDHKTLMPGGRSASELSDEELLKALQGGS